MKTRSNLPPATRDEFVDLCLADLAREVMRPHLERALNAALNAQGAWVRGLMTPDEREYILSGRRP